MTLEKILPSKKGFGIICAMSAENKDILKQLYKFDKFKTCINVQGGVCTTSCSSNANCRCGEQCAQGVCRQECTAGLPCPQVDT